MKKRVSVEKALKNWNNYTAGEVKTKTSVKPEKIEVEKYGHHVSYGDGSFRYWRFAEHKGYFRFVADYWDDIEH